MDWTARAAVHRTGEIDVQPLIGAGTLAEMVELFLAEPDAQRHALTLTCEGREGAMGLAEVQELHRRADFPGRY